MAGQGGNGEVEMEQKTKPLSTVRAVFSSEMCSEAVDGSLKAGMFTSLVLQHVCYVDAWGCAVLDGPGWCRLGWCQQQLWWDEALLTMSKGEKAQLEIEPEWAYGKKGQPDAKIPPNAKLFFEVELVDIE
uniref:peptidylprolyl isomerase n=1 Tax=Chrysolophus pictus TaxID=9089 RepID=A0A8C3L3J4_CHRPC